MEPGMKDDDMDPNAAAELRMLRAEIAALRDHIMPPDTVPRTSLEWPAETHDPVDAKWLPTVSEGHLVLPEQHYRLMQGLRDGRDLWRRHPSVRTGSQLTFGERSADVMRNAFGSWAFVGSFLGFMGAWMIVNTLLLRHSGFDKYPYILLNLCLSMMAGLQGALILIAAKRADRVSAEQAVAHYAETNKLDTLQTANNEMTERIEEATKLLAEIHRHVSALSPLAGEFTQDEEDAAHGEPE
jgi:uncharacterized membrane protein